MDLHEIKKFKYLVNAPAKIISLTAILIFAFFSLGDLNVLLFHNPSFDQLNTSEGEIKIGPSIVRGGTPFKLVINKQEVVFSCGMGSTYSDHCLQGNDAIKKYQGKMGKVWWIYNGSCKRLFQLEVEGEIIISYQEQTEKYIRSKESHFPHWIVSFVLSLYWFIRLQFTKGQSGIKR
jgi:hypothetical protein